LSINVYYDNVKFRIKELKRVKIFFNKVIRNEKVHCGDLNFIFTCDDSLLEINQIFLNHDYFTDVITFDYCVGNLINGEIYISIDSVRRNAKELKEKVNDEVIRVMVHGVLHLIGYDDKSEVDKKRIREKENYWIEDFQKG
jgi:probable rRNA maturation factor